MVLNLTVEKMEFKILRPYFILNFQITILWLPTLVISVCDAQVFTYSIHKGPYNQRSQVVRNIKENYFVYNSDSIIYFDKVNFRKNLTINDVKSPYSFSMSDVKVFGHFRFTNNEFLGDGSIMLNAKEKLIDEQPNYRVVNHHRLRKTDCLPSQPFDARAQRQVLALQTL